MAAIELNVDNFEEEVLKSEIPVIVDFWAPWCGPCQEVIPMIDELFDELNCKVKVCKVNVDGNKPLARKYRVMTIPTIILFNNGTLVKEQIYPKSKAEITAMLDEIK